MELVEEGESIYDALNEGDLDEGSDIELNEARVRLKKFNEDALKVVAQLQLEAASGKLSGQEAATFEGATTTGSIQLSDYDESGDEQETPGNSDEECIPGKRKRSSIPVVNERSDFNKLKWCVGISFPNRDLFRECVTRYAIAQGRDLTFDISDNTHGRKLGVRCKSGCPFRLYGCWDNQRAAFVVKSLDPNHTCQRTMETNRQLKSTWHLKDLECYLMNKEMHLQM
ncbi:uncharacterized protein LOC141630146 [Silene latifolia]|uniref:uncharacterized protein LOC141630146 n=1 Tax=Silene latifolia TaxID=37657 RepID=UPI003D780B20